MGDIVQLRKKGGLRRILYSANGSPISPKEYLQDVKDRNKEGKLVGDYKGDALPGTRHGIAPMWNKNKNAWAWGSDSDKLSELIGKIKLRYPKGHKEEGNFLIAGNVADRLTYFYDDFFRHPIFYGQIFMENGRVAFDLSNPVHEFLFNCYKGYAKTEDSSDPTKISSAKAAGMQYELVSPNHEVKLEKKEALAQVDAIVQLSNLVGDEDRMRAITEIMGLPGYDDNTTADGVFLLLKQQAVEQNDPVSRFSGKTARARFMELASMENESLDSCRNVVIAKNLGILRIYKDHFKLNGREISGNYDETKLISYFLKPESNKDYSELLNTLDTYKTDGRIKKARL